MSAVDDELLELAQERVGDRILAMAQFRPTALPSRVDRLPGLLWMLADWSYRRKHARLPNPAYLAVTDSTVYVFSARFGRGLRIIGPTQAWKRADLRVKRSKDNALGLRLQMAPGKPIIGIEAADPGPESAWLIRLLRDEPGLAEEDGF